MTIVRLLEPVEPPVTPRPPPVETPRMADDLRALAVGLGLRLGWVHAAREIGMDSDLLRDWSRGRPYHPAVQPDFALADAVRSMIKQRFGGQHEYMD